MPSTSVEQRQKMSYVQQFQQPRRNHSKESQRPGSAANHNFFLCSNEYAEKVHEQSRPVTRGATPSVGRERARAVVIVTRVPSISTSNSNTNDDLSILSIVSRDVGESADSSSLLCLLSSVHVRNESRRKRTRFYILLTQS